jgi:hypothetical protein
MNLVCCSLKCTHSGTIKIYVVCLSPPPIQVLMNLVCCSLKYTHSGTIKISASQSHKAAQVVVADTGAGIPPQQLQQALDPFELVRELHLAGWMGGVWGAAYMQGREDGLAVELNLCLSTWGLAGTSVC